VSRPGRATVIRLAVLVALIAAGEARAQSGAPGPGAACWARRNACLTSCAGRFPDAARRSGCIQSCGDCPAAAESSQPSSQPVSPPHAPPAPSPKGAVPVSRAWGTPPGTMASPVGTETPRTTVHQPPQPPGPPLSPSPRLGLGSGGDPGSSSGEFLLHCRGTARFEDDADPTAWSEVFGFDSVNRSVDGHTVQSWDTTVVWRTAWGELHLDLGGGQLWSEPIVRPDRMVDAHVHAACEPV